MLTLPNLVYSENFIRPNSVNSGQKSVNSSEPSLQGKIRQLIVLTQVKIVLTLPLFIFPCKLGSEEVTLF